MKKTDEKTWQTLAEIERAGGPSRRYLQNALNNKRRPLRSKKSGKNRLVRKADVLAYIAAHPSSRPPTLSVDFATVTNSPETPTPPLPMNPRELLQQVKPDAPNEARVLVSVGKGLRQQADFDREGQDLFTGDEVRAMLTLRDETFGKLVTEKLPACASEIITMLERQCCLRLRENFCAVDKNLASIMCGILTRDFYPAIEEQTAAVEAILYPPKS